MTKSSSFRINTRATSTKCIPGDKLTFTIASGSSISNKACRIRKSLGRSKVRIAPEDHQANRLLNEFLSPAFMLMRLPMPAIN